MSAFMFDEEIAAMMGRIQGLRRKGGASSQSPEFVADEATEALDTTIEPLRVTVEELSLKNEELAALQESLQQERIRYQELFDAAPGGYLVTDLQGVIREANRMATTLLNLDARFVVGKPLILFIAEPDRLSFRPVLRQ